MKLTFINLAAVSIFLILFLSACKNDVQSVNDSNQSVQNQNEISGGNANSARDDLGGLAKIINLPLEPEEANYWEENLVKADNQNSVSEGKKLIAVLKFSPENSAQLIGQIEKIRPAADSEIDAESRFPAELIARSQLSGDETLKGKAYAADNFYNVPYNKGKITRIEDTDYFVLELTTN